MVKKILFILLFGILIFPLVSSAIIINQPEKLYNVGDRLIVPVTLKATGDINDIPLTLSLICNSQQEEFYRAYFSISENEEITILPSPSVPLTKRTINGNHGFCSVKAVFGEDSFVSNDIEVSNFIEVTWDLNNSEFLPEQELKVNGNALKKNGKKVNGFAELTFLSLNSSNMSYSASVNDGRFSINFTFPKDTKAGFYILNLKAYEKDYTGEISNSGSVERDILVKQVPTSIQFILENAEVEPGTNIKIKTILKDQTGEKIFSNIVLTLKNSEGKIVDEKDVKDDEFFNYSIKYNEKPSTWTILASSNNIENKAEFIIKEKKEIKLELVNDTIVITNTGNVFYNDTTLIKIGNDSLNINPGLDVDQSKKYQLTAPDGEYNIEVIKNGESMISGKAILTGYAISINEIEDIQKFVMNPIVLFFIVFIVGLTVFFLFFKKRNEANFSSGSESLKPIINKSSENLSGRKQPVFDKKNSFQPVKQLPKGISVFEKDRRAVLTASLQGQKQEASIVALKVKNRMEVGNAGSSKETIQKMINFAEDKKGILYENGDYIMFILSPSITNSQRNEKIAVDIAVEMKKRIDEHNKMFKQRINYGISVNKGFIIAKPESGILRFMSLGNFLNLVKKISSVSNNDILLTNEINDKIRADIRTEKVTIDGINVYAVRDSKNKEESARFVGEFMGRNH